MQRETLESALERVIAERDKALRENERLKTRLAAVEAAKDAHYQAMVEAQDELREMQKMREAAGAN